MKKLLGLLFTALLLLSLGSLGVLPWSPFSVSPNLIRWVTQSEDEVFGYDVYRGANESGPFQRINAEIILGAGTTDLPQRYVYSDEAIEAGKVYWYYVESISLSGERSRLTPTYASRPKIAFPW